MDLYKIKYDIRRPDIDQLTINKDSRFAIQLELIQPKDYNVRAVDNITGGDYPVLIIKKSDGSEDEYYYSDLTIDEMYDEQIHTYIWKIDKFNQDISCCVDLYVYYYNEETEEEKEYDQPSLCVCKVACKDSSLANDGVTYNEYDYSTGIKIGKNTYIDGDSIAIGKEAYAEDNGIAIGISSSGAGVDSIAIGKNAATGSDNAILIGKGANVSYRSPNSIAIGAAAKVEHDLSGKIQLGAGTLSAANTLMQVKNFPLLDETGTILGDRLRDSYVFETDGGFFSDYVVRSIEKNPNIITTALADAFESTEYGLLGVPIVDGETGAIWYLQITNGEINLKKLFD